MATLPYMYQLPSDYYTKNLPTAPPPVVTEPEPIVIGVIPPVSYGTPDEAYQMGGVWVGTVPPASPSYGWMWLNSANNGLYVFGDPAPGVWSQIGTNW